MNLAQELERLDQLRVSGSLSNAEFQAAKEKLLGRETQPPFKISDSTIYGIDERTYCTLMHASQLLVFSAVGIVVPVLMWILGKDKSDMVNRHGNRMMNWIISGFIYAIVSGILMFVVIGIPMAIAVAIMSFVFPILAAIKANSGEIWSYPLSIKFLPEV